MPSSNRNRVMLSVIFIVLTIAAIWNTSLMYSEKSHARIARQDLNSSNELASDIIALKNQPTLVFAQAMEVQELGERLDAALKLAEATNTLGSVTPRSPRRVGESPYIHKPTELRLNGLSLNQLVTFLHHLTSDSSLTVSDLRLVQPTQPAPRFVWNAEATVSYLIYSP